MSDSGVTKRNLIRTLVWYWLPPLAWMGLIFFLSAQPDLPGPPSPWLFELLSNVGLPKPETIGDAYPFHLSGGQRQRVMIAMALALEPAILIADEPTTALDVTTQAQILSLIKRIQQTRHMGVILITHDFGVVAEISDRVAVMQFGKIVETGTTKDVLNRPNHPYTRRLINSVPRLKPMRRDPPSGKPLLAVDRLDKTYVT